MAKLNINGQSVNVDDSFLSLPPAEQEKTVNEIAASMGHGAAPDKYQQAALEDYAKAKAAGAPTGESVANEFVNGATFGAAPTITAAMATPLEMIKRGTWNPVEGYSYAKAYNDLLRDKTREAHPIASTAMNLAGGLTSAGGLAKQGYTLVQPGQSLLGRVGAMAGEGAGYGALTGFNEGNGIEDRAMGAAKGGALGGAIGGALPVAGSVAKTALSPVISNALARVDPEGAARARLARALSESGLGPKQIGDEVSNAAASGQGSYTLADALGKPGQELLSTVARAPGEGQTAVSNFLNARQAGQASRVGEQIDTALGTGPTAKQSVDDLIAQGKTASRPLYDKAMEVGPVWDNRIQQFLDEPIVKEGLGAGIKQQRLEALAKGEKFDPHDYAITDFDAAGDPVISGVPNMRTLQAAKIGLDQLVEQHRNEFGNLTPMGRSIDMVRKAFLDKLTSYNPDYAAANAAFAGPAQVRGAVKVGQQAASRGRAADNLDAFSGLDDASKQGFRIGYADTRNAALERAPEGSNVVRPLSSEKFQTELPALSLHNGPYQPGQADTLSQRLARENTMFETRARALGGSKTADNLANNEAAGIDPRLALDVATGNVHGLAKRAWDFGVNGLTGNTANVRSKLAELLLKHGENANAESLLQSILAQPYQNQKIQNARSLGRALLSGAGAGIGSESGQRR